MEPERWKKIDELFKAAMAQPAEKRADILQRACPGDPELRAEVESLLDAAGGASSFLEGSPLASAADPGTTHAMFPDEIAGAVIGRYHLLQKIGEGGMGEVWLAEQKEPVRRRVALKLVKAGMNSREVIARFESERQALALMDHPAIAKVFDAGATPDGAPYFVMEYVAGVPITNYCDNHRLSTRERLDLFVRVCEGVQHAHQKAIIHRDLKPSNILVINVDGRAAPKIIDFGVAKALTQKLTADTMFTRVGALLGTPQYMSPEQADSSGEDIDTRTDVYSLGIILYELLAGAPPLDMRRIAFEEFLRKLREEEPAKPSTKIRTQDAAASTALAHKRQTEPLTLAKEIRGDLDSITLKALEKDRSRRYGSPSDLAADIGRHLNNEAVLAVPPSAAYRARKFARRYRAALATAGAFLLVLLLAAGISIWQSIRATKQRDRADAAAAAAQAVNDFLQNDLLAQASATNQSGPAAKPDRDLKVRTALDRAAARIAGKFDRQPEVEASIRDTIGQTYADLGLYPEARKQLERALDLHRQVHGAEDPRTLNTMRRLGRLAVQQGKFTDAAALFSQAMAIQRRVLGLEHRDTLASMNGLADVYSIQGKYAQAEALYQQILEIRRRVPGSGGPETLASIGLANLYYVQGKFAQAEPLFSQDLQIKRRALGPEHPNTLATMNNLANVYDALGKESQAETLYSQSLEIERRVLGPEHLETLGTMANLANVYNAQGKHAQAEALFKQTLEIQRRVLGPEHPDTLDSLSEIALMYQREGKYALAETYAAQSLTGRRHVLPEHPDTMGSASDLALIYISEGKFTQGESLAREVVDTDRKKRADNWQRFRAESVLGASLAGQKKYSEAEPWLLEGYRGMMARGSQMEAGDLYYLDRAREWLVQLYDAWGQPAKAVEFRKK